MSFNVKDYGAYGDGAHDDSGPIRQAIAAALGTAAGGIVFFPAGTYLISRDGSQSYCLGVSGNNLEFQGEGEMSIIKAATGLPSGVKIFLIDDRSNIAFRNLVIDGNWGNAITAIAASSNDTPATSTTYYVEDTSAFPSSGTFTLVTYSGAQVVTYTGKSSTSFLGCTGGAGTLKRNYPVIYVDDNQPINYAVGSSPSCHAISSAGTHNLTIENCRIQNVYGDGVYCGLPSSGDHWKPSRRVRIAACTIQLCARNGITAGQSTDGLTVEDCYVEWPIAQGFDTEPNNTDFYARNVRITRTKLGIWANPYRGTTNAALSIAGGAASSPGPENYARGYRVEQCVIGGSVLIGDAVDCVIRDNRIMCDWASVGGRP